MKQKYKKSSQSDIFQSRFINTQALLQGKLETSVRKFTQRLNASRYSVHSERKGVPISKQLARSSIISTKDDPSSQRIFNHFEMNPPDLTHTSDFGKKVARKGLIENRQEKQSSYDTQKSYLSYYYKETPMKCLFDLSKGKPAVHKIIKQQHTPSVKFENLLHGEEFLGIKNYKKIPAFWQNSGRELPPSNQIKAMSRLTDHWRIQDKFIRKQQNELLFKAITSYKNNNQGRKVQGRNYCLQMRMRKRLN